MYIYVNVHMLLFYPVLEGRQYQSFETLISPFYQVHLPQSVLSQRDLLSRSRCPTQCPISRGGSGVLHNMHKVQHTLDWVWLYCVQYAQGLTHTGDRRNRTRVQHTLVHQDQKAVVLYSCV